MGHSQGGGGAWAFAEGQARKPINGYKGAVAIGPPTSIVDQVNQAVANVSLPWAPITFLVQTNIIAAVTAVYPAYNYSGMTPLSYDRWNNVLGALQGCFPTDNLVFSDVPADQLARPGWQKDPTVLSWGKLAKAGREKFKGPLLVISGEGDVVIPTSTVEAAVDDTCSMLEAQKWDESLELIKYSAVDHFPSIQASQLQWLDWVKDTLGPALAATWMHQVPG